MELFEHCRGCARYLRSCSGMSKEVCEQHDLRVPITNADRIRGMTDEELAHFLEMKAGRFVSFYPTSAKNWLGWLRQEAEE